jgi:hypothetical protein
MYRPASGARLKIVLAEVVNAAVEGFEADTLRFSAHFRLLNDVRVGLVFGEGVLSFFSMTSLKSCWVHGWERHKKA